MLRPLRALQQTGGLWSCGTASSEPLPPQACQEKTDAFLFLFSFTDRASFEDLPGQLARVAGEAPGVVRMVVGSKYPLGGPCDCQRPHVARHAADLCSAVGPAPQALSERLLQGLPQPPGVGSREEEEAECDGMVSSVARPGSLAPLQV